MFIKERIEKKANVEFSSCLLNLYHTGKDSVNWHQDNEKELGQNPIIGSVSFGETRLFQLKHLGRKDLKKVDIPKNLFYKFVNKKVVFGVESTDTMLKKQICLNNPHYSSKNRNNVCKALSLSN